MMGGKGRPANREIDFSQRETRGAADGLKHGHTCTNGVVKVNNDIQI